MKHKIVVLDSYTLNPGDLSWDEIHNLGTVSIYERTPPSDVISRSKEAQIILTNKVVLDSDTIKQLPNLKCICVTATGFNNVDISYAKACGITVSNVVGYGSYSVAQHVFAMVLKWTNETGKYCAGVHRGDWSNAPDWTYWNNPIVGLEGKTFGIYGLGKIGNAVADIALAFGMKVIALHKHPERDFRPDVTFVDHKELFNQSDFLSLHAPLSTDNADFINKDTLRQMKPNALLINTGRGGLVNEMDLKNALEQGTIAAAALDVLSEEPPKNDHPLLGVENCIITPHQAWATLQARQKLLNETIENIKAFQNGKPRNVVNV